MKLLGLIGGMSWESTAIYYKLFNEMIKEELGGFHSCHTLIYSLDFAEIEDLQHKGDLKQLLNIMLKAGKKLQKAGADLILIGTNTMHEFYDEMNIELDVPILHIADAVGWQLKKRALNKPALLGTRFTMEKNFYKDRLINKYNNEVFIPNPRERELIHSIIYEELVHGKFLPESRKKMIDIILRLKEQGADCAVLGCTEIPLLVRQQDIDFPIVDTTKTHAAFAINNILDLT